MMTPQQEKLIKSGMNRRNKIQKALPMNPLGYITQDESPNTATCVSVLLFNLAKYQPQSLMKMYNSSKDVLSMSRKLMIEKGRVGENEGVTKCGGFAIANVLDCYWLEPMRENAWDAPGQRLANPDEQVEHFLNYDPKMVQPAIGLAIDSTVVNSEGLAYVIADGGNGTVINTMPEVIQNWVNTFFDDEKGVLKKDADFNRSTDMIVRMLQDNPVFVQVYLDHDGTCPLQCDDKDSVRRRVIEIFRKNNKGEKAEIPNNINNVHLTKMQEGSYERAIGDVVKNMMVNVGATTGLSNDSLGGFSGDFEKLLTTMMNNGMNFTPGWGDACMFMSSRMAIVRGEVVGFNDMDLMVWNNVFQTAVRDYKAMGFKFDHNSVEFKALAEEFEQVVSFYAKSGAFQVLGNMVDVNRELQEGVKHDDGKKFEYAARVLLELHSACFGTQAWDNLFNSNGQINIRALRTYTVVDSDNQVSAHTLENLVFYTGDKNKSYFFKDGKKSISSVQQLAKLVNPQGVDKVKKQEAVAKEKEELLQRLAQLEAVA